MSTGTCENPTHLPRRAIIPSLAGYAIAHDSHRRCPGLSIASRAVSSTGTTERYHGREWQWQIQPVSLTAPACRHRSDAVVASLAREGGLPSTFWAGPETIARSVRQGTHAVQGLAKRNVASLKLGFGGDTYGYSIDLGYPPPPPPATMFDLDPHVKRECIWHGPLYRKASALVDRRNNFVWLSTTENEEPVMLTQHLSDTDSMLASIADPQRCPEMLAVREAVRG
jgi:hypothetical protein